MYKRSFGTKISTGHVAEIAALNYKWRLYNIYTWGLATTANNSSSHMLNAISLYTTFVKSLYLRERYTCTNDTKLTNYIDHLLLQ